MRLEHLVDLQLRYDGDPTIVRPFGSPTGSGYGAGTGTAKGSLEGSLRWTNVAEFRADGVGLPRIDGVLRTDDGADVLLSLRGLAVLAEDGGRKTTYAVTFATEHERYAHLNAVLAVAEASVVDPSSPLDARVYVCVNEL